MTQGLECYRVPISRGGHARMPIIAASSVDEAREKGEVLARQLFGARLPWLMENGRHKPSPEAPAVEVFVGEPVRAHGAGGH